MKGEVVLPTCGVFYLFTINRGGVWLARCKRGQFADRQAPERSERQRYKRAQNKGLMCARYSEALINPL